MKNDAKSTTQCKHGMLMELKLKASYETWTMTMSTKPQMVKVTQNSPEVDQNEAKTHMEQSQNML